MKEEITHKGIVEKIEGNTVFVSIVSHSACASCTVKGACNVSEMENKLIEVKGADTSLYKLRDEVEVYMAQSLGTKAVFLGYLLPFIILVGALIIFSALLDNEGLAGLFSILLLVPYYTVLHFSRDRLRKTFEFKLRPRF